MAIAKVEFPSHKRILEDSINLIKSTKNLNTLLTRHEIAQEEYSWIKSQMNAGVPIFFKSNRYFPDELREYANVNIVRIADAEYVKYAAKKKTLKTDKAKDNLHDKYTNVLNECLFALLAVKNQKECISEIASLITKL
ncbi:hypothetical protein SDC9_178342 [bioreactor metagenome]|uniref:Uncharacterized protein n=1 Tax=bioreactor metagenome TaxID=1076179 RepID=A0A645GVI1_9ZZZZ